MAEVSINDRRARLGRWGSRCRVLVAALLVAAVAAGVGPASLGTSVSAAEIPNTATTGFINPRTTSTSVGQNAQVDIVVDWRVPGGTSQGDTIRLELPPTLRELTFQNFFVFDQDSGRVLAIASMERDTSTGPANSDAWVVFTFTAVVEEGGSGASGTAGFSLSIEQSKLDFSSGDTTTIQVYGSVVEVRQQIPEARTGKSGSWTPSRFVATRLDDNGRLIQTSQHQLWTISIQTDTSADSADDWTEVTITEEPRTDFSTNCSVTGGPFTSGFKLQVYDVGANNFVDVPRPSASGASITSVVCDPDGSTSVVVEKLATDTDRQYRIQYYTDLATLDGRPAYVDEDGELVVGFPEQYRNDAMVFIDDDVDGTEVSTAIRAKALRAVGILSNAPAIDIEKYSGTWDGVEFNADGTAAVTPGPDYEPIVQPTGDFDTGPGADLDPAVPQPVQFTVTNIGTERLVDIVVVDSTDIGPALVNIVCTFPDNSTGTTWAGPFVRSASFPCVGELPAMGSSRQHVDTARVDAIGFTTRTPVFDEDVWQAFADGPGIDIEKFSGTWGGVVFTGFAPNLDGTGQPVPQPSDDFDTGALNVASAQAVPVKFVITNTGTVPLENIQVSDVTDTGPALTGLTCTFPGGSTGTSWPGPFAAQASFPCTATMPGLAANVLHTDTATVVGEFVTDQQTVTLTDSDAWGAVAPPVPPPPPPPPPPTDEPGIDIEKFSGTWGGVVFNAGAASLDASGQPVPQPTDDFDTGALKVPEGQSIPVQFVITNTGTGSLTDIAVADATSTGRALTGLTCTFPDTSTGTTWSGPFDPQASFECRATLPGLDPGERHVDTATVTGIFDGIGGVVTLTDSDAWGAEAPPQITATTVATTVPQPPTTPRDGLPDTGGSPGQLSLWAAILLGLGFVTVALASRRRHA